jgi:uncharacterized protein
MNDVSSIPGDKPVPFWKVKSLRQMTRKEWNSLCDGCGKCCVFKLEDVKKKTVTYTDVSCRLLDLQTCRCISYRLRRIRVFSCLRLTPRRVKKMYWLPKTCAYRLVYEGKELPPWHYLVSGDPASIHKLGHSVLGKVIPEKSIDLHTLPGHIKEWD